MSRRLLIKLGGRAFETEAGFKELASAIEMTTDLQVVIVHGGGAEISQTLKEMGRVTSFVDGIRVTQAEDIQIIDKVLSGTINKRIAGWLTKYGLTCVRMSGKTRHLFLVEPLQSQHGHDYGFVGQIKNVNGGVVLEALGKGHVPVISPISSDEHGLIYNVNADTAAASLAAEINCDGIVFITDVPGVMVDKDVCESLTPEQAKHHIQVGTIKGGMVAKMVSAFAALEKGVPAAYVLKWEGVDTLRDLAVGICHSGTVIRA